ncbi:hypothetical protein [Marinobacter confluentis]|uniref:Lipoprotein n=1 Tax=Marinobacter confluentis TaxID=1697557 RepID=A0A4Z1BIU3_9GAMM|nr:hypothetical protein [Marinobacter confluentis]TGN39459.1 hypothetical protein E5Q11_12605 [Marinobacter confluentis]
MHTKSFYSEYANLLLIALLATFLSGCGPETTPPPITDYDADKGHCFSMTPLLQVLPQESELENFEERSRYCTFSTIFATYAPTDPDISKLHITLEVIDGESPFAHISESLPGSISRLGASERYITDAGTRSLDSYKRCLHYSVKMEQARQRNSYSIHTREFGYLVCISSFGGAFEDHGSLTFRPLADILITIQYTRDQEEYRCNGVEVAEFLLPLMKKLRIPTEDWPSPVDETSGSTEHR